MSSKAESSSAAGAREEAACFIIDSSISQEVYADLVKSDGVIASLVGRLLEKSGAGGAVSCAAVFTSVNSTASSAEHHSAQLSQQTFLAPSAFIASLPALRSELVTDNVSARSRNGFGLAAWQNGFGSSASASAKGKGRESDLLEGIVAGLDMFHVQSSHLNPTTSLDSMFPALASSLQATLDREITRPTSKHLIIIAPPSSSSASTSQGSHVLRRTARSEYDELGWESLADTFKELDVACSGILIGDGMKAENGAEGSTTSPLKSLLSKTASTRDPPWFQHDQRYDLYLTRFATAQPTLAQSDPIPLLPAAPIQAQPPDEVRQRYMQIQALALRNAALAKASGSSGSAVNVDLPPDLANMSPAELQAQLQRHSQLAAMQKARETQTQPSRLWTGELTWSMSDQKNSGQKIEAGVKVYATATQYYPPEDLLTHLWPTRLNLSGVVPLNIAELETHIKSNRLPCVFFSVPTELPADEAARNLAMYTQLAKNLHSRQTMGLIRFGQKDCGMVLLPNLTKNASNDGTIRILGVVCLKTPLPQMANKPPNMGQAQQQQQQGQAVNNYPQQGQPTPQQVQQVQQLQAAQAAQQQAQIQQLQQAQLQAQQLLQRQAQPQMQQAFQPQQQQAFQPQMLQQQISAAQRNLTPSIPGPPPTAPSNLPMGLSAANFTQLQAMIKNSQLPDVDPNTDLTTYGKEDLHRLIQKIVERQSQQTAANQRQQQMQHQMQGQYQ